MEENNLNSNNQMNTKTNVNQQTQSNKSNNKFFLVLMVLIIIGLVGYIVYAKLIEKGPDKPKDNNIQEQQNGNYVFYVCNDNTYTVNLHKDTSKCNEMFGTIKTETENAKVLAAHRYYKEHGKVNRMVVLVDDNGLKIYDTENNVKKINIENVYSEYYIIPMDDGISNGVLGVEYLNNGNRMFYNVKTNKNISVDASLNYGTADGDFIIAQNPKITDEERGNLMGQSEVLISADSGKIILESEIINDGNLFFDAYKFSNKYFYIRYTDVLTVYSNDYKKIVSGGLSTITSDGYLYHYEKDSNLLKYNIDGKLVSTITDYKKIKMLSNDFVVFTNEKNELMLHNLVTNESKKITDIKNNDVIYDELSFYRENIINITHNNVYREDGLYVVIVNNNNWTEYYYNPQTKNIETRNLGKAESMCSLEYEFSYCD